MNKKWVLKDRFPEKYRKEFPEESEVGLQLLFEHEIKNKEERENFLNLNYDRDLHDPFLILGMKKAVKRILRAINSNEKIVIFGDYDADGVCGSAQLYSFFRQIEYDNIHIYIPNRFKEGYGLTLGAIDQFIDKKAKLIITVDCGITNVKEVERANENDIDVIITDHHLVPKKAPQAFVIVDSKQAEDKYPFKFLSGSGVVFKLIQAIIIMGKFNIQKDWEKWLLDLVAIATIADMVSMKDENRVLVYFGFKVLQRTRRVGLNTLYKKLKLTSSDINEGDIGFLIAPRINLASRMGHAMTSFNLLITEDPNEAEQIALDLEMKNEERKKVVQTIIDVVDHKYSSSSSEIPEIIVAGDPEWMPGVLGLTANRLVEKYQRSVFLWGKMNSPDIKGSCRSDGSVDLVKLMEKSSDIFLGFGGHSMAAGFSILEENLGKLESNLLNSFKTIDKMENTSALLNISSPLSIDSVRWSTWEIVSRFAPFGMDNPQPIFLFSGIEIFNTKTFGNGGVHLELTFKKSNNEPLRAIGFFMDRNNFEELKFKAGERIDLVASFDKSNFRNIPEIRLRIVDIRKS